MWGKSIVLTKGGGGAWYGGEKRQKQGGGEQHLVIEPSKSWRINPLSQQTKDFQLPQPSDDEARFEMRFSIQYGDII